MYLFFKTAGAGKEVAGPRRRASNKRSNPEKDLQRTVGGEKESGVQLKNSRVHVAGVLAPWERLIWVKRALHHKEYERGN